MTSLSRIRVDGCAGECQETHCSGSGQLTSDRVCGNLERIGDTVCLGYARLNERGDDLILHLMRDLRGEEKDQWNRMVCKRRKLFQQGKTLAVRQCQIKYQQRKRYFAQELLRRLQRARYYPPPACLRAPLR